MKKKKQKYKLDPKIFAPDPRSLGVVSQIIYVIRCLERGLSQHDIVALYMNDASAVSVIMDVVKDSGLITRDDKGKWRRTNKARRLIQTSRAKDLMSN